MRYTRIQVRDMSSMEYWEAMCQELKKAGFQGQRGNRPPHDYEPFDAVFGGDIVFNLNAVRYLRNIGLLDNGVLCVVSEKMRQIMPFLIKMVQHFMFARNVISSTHNRKSKNGAVLVVLQFL